jgi:hypothetical protein
VHYLHPQSSTIEYISPSVNNFAFRTHDALVEVETIQVECHRANSKSSEPNTNNRPSSQKEM